MSEWPFATRRRFLRDGLTILSAGWTAPTFLTRTAEALGAPKRDADARVLVVLQLAGGNDGLNTVIPYRDDAYYRARPRLAIARKDALSVTDDVGLHPRAEGLKRLYDDGLLAIVQGVGYPNHDRSHFRSTDIWESADPAQRMHNGWLGRYFDCTCKGADRPDPRSAIALTAEAPLSLLGERFSPVSFGTPDQLQWQPGRVSQSARDAFERLNAAPSTEPSSAASAPLSTLEYLQRTAMDARLSAREIQEAAGGGRRRGLDGRRGGGRGMLSQQLAMVARMIASGLPTTVYYVSLGGFDTHAGQDGRHAQLIQELGEALSSFMDDLKERRQSHRVLLMTFSEFGRRVAENASQGTDHGAAAPMFLVGESVRAGMHGRHPSLVQLDQGDLKWGIDFRSVYAEVLSGWLGTDARRILGMKFPSGRLLRANAARGRQS